MFAKPRNPNLAECDIAAVISEAIQLIENQISDEKMPEILFHSDPSEIIIPVDLNMIKQVIWNLVQNAIQSMPDGGKLVVMVVDRNSPHFSGTDSMLEIKGEFHSILDDSIMAEYVEIYIKDTGCGIKKSQFKKLFDPFYTTKERGSGLGLAIVHKIIESHRGKIYVESKEHKGTTFNIFLPTNHEVVNIKKDSELQKNDTKVKVP
jgi:signal transduction histidine kinase